MSRVTIQTAADFIRTNGPAPPELAELIAVAANVVDFEAERANRPPRFIEVVGDYRNGVPVADIVKKYQCSKGTVLRYARMAGLPTRPKGFADNRRDLVIEMYKSNRPIAEIAAAMGVSQAYVSKTAVEEGINRRVFK